MTKSIIRLRLPFLVHHGACCVLNIWAAIIISARKEVKLLAEFSIIPVGKGESLSKDVAEVLRIVEQSNLRYKFGPMGTTVEGEWEEVMGLIKRCRDKLLEGRSRVYLTIKIDDRKGAKNRITGKVRSVERNLGRKLSQ